MSPTFIAITILCGVALMAAIAFIAQEIENKKRERNLKLIGLKAGLRRATHLFDAFPRVLMSVEIHTLLCKYIENRWAGVIALDPSKDNQQQRNAFQAQATTLPEATSHPAGSMTVFNTPSEAIRAMGIIKEFAQFLTEINSKGDINSNVASNLAREAKRTYSRIEVDLDLLSAYETEQSRGPEVVIHQYRSCFSKLQNLNNNQALDRQLYEIRTHVTRLAEQIDMLTEQKAREKEKQKDTGKKFNF